MNYIQKVLDVIMFISPFVFTGFAIYGFTQSDGDAVFECVVLSLLCVITNHVSGRYKM